ncbi:MAG: serine/threonine protein kinase [Nannocystaceae bacterium]|nr:serine/threonine protein kinase [Nannocystaceae bacterium]
MSDGWGQPGELLGRILEGRYRVDRIIGQGGMGTVFEGVHFHIEKRVALKVLSPAMARDENHRARFLNEARAAARISSPHVVSITDYGRGSVAFVVMEFLEGEDLAQRLAKTGPLGVEDVLGLLRQICAGLEAAHKKGVVHRDIKPSNIFLAKDEEDKNTEVVKILDFGIAKLFDANRHSKGITRPHEAVGTAAYMAPEQVLGGEVDRRSDIYSLGVVLFRMLVGKIPFRAENSFGMMEQHVRALPPALNIGSPKVESVVLRCLEKDREKRFSDAGALLREFENAVNGGGPEDFGKGARKRTLVPLPQDGRVKTEVSEDPGLARAVEQSSAEQVLTSRERSAPARHDSTLPSVSVLPAPGAGDGSSAGGSERPAPLTLALVLGCSMVVGGAAFAWRYSSGSGQDEGAGVQASALVPHRDAAPMPDPLDAPSTTSSGSLLPMPEPQSGPTVVLDIPELRTDVGAVGPADGLLLEEPALAMLEVSETDVATPDSGSRSRRRRARQKRASKTEAPVKQHVDPLESMVAETMVREAQKAALSDQAHCFQLASEAHAMHPSQRAAVVMTKCACRLGDAVKVAAAGKLLHGEHPKLKRLCELKGVELVLE